MWVFRVDFPCWLFRVGFSVDRGGPRPYNYHSPIWARAVSVAQLAEHQTVALAVAGSIPVTHPIIFMRL